MGWQTRSGVAEEGLPKKIRMEDGKLIGPEGGRLCVRVERKGFWAGCTFVTWEAWDQMKKEIGE